MKRSLFFQTASLWLLSLPDGANAARYSSSILAFVQPQRSTPRRKVFRHQYIADPSNEFQSDANVTPPKVETNEWGIPHHSTLEPLGPTSGSQVPDQLPNGGRVSLVGAGPGDPELLTLAAYKLLTENPDALVIADRLVSEEILELIPSEIKIARKLPGCQELAQEEIFSWVHEGLKQGKHVIRLKIGDPFVFGRGGEEVLIFRDFGVESKVIPVSTHIFARIVLLQQYWQRKTTKEILMLHNLT